MAVFCIVVIVVVTAIGIIWPEVPDHGLGDRFDFRQEFFVFPVGSRRTQPYVQQILAMCLHQQ